MINYLEGTVIAKGPGEMTVLTGGVGYQVCVSSRTLRSTRLNEPAKLFIYTHVREDSLSLYGFSTEDDKDIFKLLLSVAGIGPKTALSICAQAGDEIKQAVMDADVQFFSDIPGIGKKSAQRIIVDLKPKLGTLKELDLAAKEATEYTRAKQALQGLGFSAAEAVRAIALVSDKDRLKDEEIIKEALRQLGK